MRLPSPHRPGWLTFPRFAWFTAGLTLLLMVLGIYTAAIAAGLACSAQWPLCDDGLLPQTFPSFVEWFHRLVAMIAGWFIIGTAIWSWRAGGRVAKSASTLAVILLPLQISVGAVTVTLSGALPQGYSAPTHATHLLVALAIFSLLVLTALFAHTEGRFPYRLQTVLAGATVVLPISALFSRLPPLAYSPSAQAVFYAVSLVGFAALLIGIVLSRRARIPSVGLLAGGALLFHLAHMLLGRDLVFYTDTVQTVNAAVILTAIVLACGATWLAYRSPEATGSVGDDRSVRGD